MYVFIYKSYVQFVFNEIPYLTSFFNAKLLLKLFKCMSILFFKNVFVFVLCN